MSSLLPQSFGRHHTANMNTKQVGEPLWPRLKRGYTPIEIRGFLKLIAYVKPVSSEDWERLLEIYNTWTRQFVFPVWTVPSLYKQW